MRGTRVIQGGPERGRSREGGSTQGAQHGRGLQLCRRRWAPPGRPLQRLAVRGQPVAGPPAPSCGRRCRCTGVAEGATPLSFPLYQHAVKTKGCSRTGPTGEGAWELHVIRKCDEVEGAVIARCVCAFGDVLKYQQMSEMIYGCARRSLDASGGNGASAHVCACRPGIAAAPRPQTAWSRHQQRSQQGSRREQAGPEMAAGRRRSRSPTAAPPSSPPPR